MTPEERAKRLVLDQFLSDSGNWIHPHRAVELIVDAIRAAEGEAARRAILSYIKDREPEMEAIRQAIETLKDAQADLKERCARELWIGARKRGCLQNCSCEYCEILRDASATIRTLDKGIAP